MTVYYESEQVTLWHGDCVDVLATLAANSIDAVVTDPPYGLEFMGKDWDRFGRDTGNHAHSERPRFTSDHMGKGFDKIPNTYEAGPTVPILVYDMGYGMPPRALKPGGHLLAFGGSRTWHRLAAAIEDAGFELRDSIAWLYGSGFPKSLDVSKAIDKTAGAEREVVGSRRITGCSPDRAEFGANDRTGGKGMGFRPGDLDITAASTDAAKQWQGWGTALKPAFEPIVVARKPLIGTVAQNVLAHGTGALNIDGCRVEYEQGGSLASNPSLRESINGGNGGNIFPVESERRVVTPNPAGRWPTNVALDADQAAELDKQNGTLKSGGYPPEGGQRSHRATFGQPNARGEAKFGASEGGASRFFPVFKYSAKAATTERPTADGVAHPTVKPLELMRWLVRLVTPPHGVVLDLFAGTGTTGEAAIHEHMRAILIERELAYLPLIVARLSKPMAIGFDFETGEAS